MWSVRLFLIRKLLKMPFCMLYNFISLTKTLNNSNKTEICLLSIKIKMIFLQK